MLYRYKAIDQSDGIERNGTIVAATVDVAIAALQRARATGPRPAQATLGAPVRQNSRREQALRVRLEDRGGTLMAILNGPQGSHVITSLVGADALALIPAGPGTLGPGTVVALAPLPR